MFVKRVFDVMGASACLAVLAPVFLVLALIVRIKLGTPVFFSQERPGKDGRVFRIIKFRTMTDKRDHLGNPLPDGERLTEFGKWLRASSLDELPELWNVIRGEMSLVGPRPLLVEYLPLYSQRQSRRHEVRPGITGWAQVSGRNAIDWEQRLELDVWYIDNWSLVLDLKILGMTAIKVLRREGITKTGHATVDRFRGDLQDPHA
jgi:lipopolysaccharide/colanic/teichoic acid biosynthesis glycosyltransferase